MDSNVQNNVDMNVVQKSLPWGEDEKSSNTKWKTEDDIVDHVAHLLNSGQYYSWAGLALLAVNPCKNVPHMYTKEVKELYNRFEKVGIKSELKPHIYAVAARARHRIIYEIGSVNQIISISGDSGSGKTYSAKQILEFLSTYDLHDSQYDVAKVPGTLWQIWCSLPVLTAFGNAQTECNDNSSRFGKLLQLQYDDGKIVGAFIQTYLLEKTRVAFQGSKERNFHIFHQLLSGLSQNELSSLYLSHKTFYRIIPGAINLEDRDRFLETKVAMMDIGITEKMKQSVFMVLAAIINLGNITFVRKDGHFDIDRNCAIAAQNVSRLLGLTETTLKELLTSRQISTQGSARRRASVYHKPAGNVEECNAKRDCLMRLIYERLFLWIVSMINNKVQADGRYLELGILDIYGFEAFENNSLEQLCINYANERLQQFFVKDFIKRQQEIFLEEGIQFKLSPDLENEERLRALDSSVSILGILDEECSLRRNTNDIGLYQRIAISFRKSSVVICPTPNTSTQEHPNFMFRHYAGQVSYSVHHMLEKNTDHIPQELTDTLGHSLHPFVRLLFHNPLPINRKHTVLGKFKNLLDSLIKLLEVADVHYVRCIKAAPKFVPEFVDKSFLRQQLKSSGIMEVININQRYFPVMMNYDEFEERFAPLLRSFENTVHSVCNKRDNEDAVKVEKRGSRTTVIKEAITVALGTTNWNLNVFFGKKTLFLTESAVLQLENKRHSVRTEAAKSIQRNWRVQRARRLLEPKKSKDETDEKNEECQTKSSDYDSSGVQECDKKELKKEKFIIDVRNEEFKTTEDNFGTISTQGCDQKELKGVVSTNDVRNEENMKEEGNVTTVKITPDIETFTDRSNKECETEDPVCETTDVEHFNVKKFEDRHISDNSIDLKECGTKEPFSDTDVVLQLCDEKPKVEKCLTGELKVEECTRNEISSNVVDAPVYHDEKPKEDQSIDDVISLGKSDKIEPSFDTSYASKSDKNEYSCKNHMSNSESKETPKVDEKQEIVFKPKPAVNYKHLNSSRSFYVSKGIISRRPIPKVPVRLHIKRTCIPNSHFLPISEIPRGLEDALR